MLGRSSLAGDSIAPLLRRYIPHVLSIPSPTKNQDGTPSS
jgi:hypothetical protein